MSTTQTRNTPAHKSNRARPIPELLLEIAYRLHATRVLVRPAPKR